MWNDCLKDFVKAETKLKEKLQGMIAANNKYKNLNQEFLQMDLLMKILKVDPKLRPSTQEILQHSVFWDDKKSLEFILEIRKKLDVIKYSYLNGIKSEYVKLLKRIQIELKYLDKKFESLLKKDLKHKKAFGDLTNKITLLNKRLVKPNLEDECKKAWHKILDEVKNKMNDLDDVFKEDHHKKIKNFFENLITKVGQKSFSDQQKVLQDIQNEITKVMKDIGLNLHQPFKSFVTGVPTIRNNSMCHQKILEDLLGLTISLEQNQKKKKEEYQNVLERVKKAIEAIEPEFIYDDQRAASQGIQSKVEVLDPAFIVKIKNDYAIIGQAIREAVSTVDPMFEINNEPFIKEMKDIFNIFDDKKELKVTDEQLDVVTLGELVKCLDESPELDQIKNWKIQVNKDLVEELKGPHQENVSDLLRAMRNKVSLLSFFKLNSSNTHTFIFFQFLVDAQRRIRKGCQSFVWRGNCA